MNFITRRSPQGIDIEFVEYERDVPVEEIAAIYDEHNARKWGDPESYDVREILRRSVR